MQLDAGRLELFVNSATSLWDGAYQIAGYLFVIYTLIGESTWAGAGVMLAAIPVNVIVFFFIAFTYRKLAKYTDYRTKTTNETLQAILGIKMAAWEENMTKRIRDFRKTELMYLRRLLVLVALVIAIIFTIPTVGAVVAINQYANSDGVVDAATLFAVVNAFAPLMFPLIQVCSPNTLL